MKKRIILPLLASVTRYLKQQIYALLIHIFVFYAIYSTDKVAAKCCKRLIVYHCRHKF
ncbi:MAG: hypothetical protein LBH29_01145 [Elusimicrobiota bacterium]|nr:hypothetical protein [Elusimicrobiota bacterium]